MIWSFLLAAALAYVMFRLGCYVMMVSIYTGIVKVAIFVIVLSVIIWLYRRFTRIRRGKVRQIPRL